MTLVLFFIENIFDFYIILLLLRAWIYFTHCNVNNFLINYIIFNTQPIIRFSYKYIPSFGPFDNSSLFMSFLFSFLKLFTLRIIENGLFNLSILILILCVLDLLKIITKIFFWMLIIRVILSWISHSAFYYNNVIYQLSEPILIPIRYFLNLFVVKDISLIVSLILFYILNIFLLNLFLYIKINFI